MSVMIELMAMSMSCFLKWIHYSDGRAERRPCADYNKKRYASKAIMITVQYERKTESNEI